MATRSDISVGLTWALFSCLGGLVCGEGFLASWGAGEGGRRAGGGGRAWAWGCGGGAGLDEAAFSSAAEPGPLATTGPVPGGICCLPWEYRSRIWWQMSTGRVHPPPDTRPREAGGEPDRQTERETDRQTDRDRERETETDRQTDREIW